MTGSSFLNFLILLSTAGLGIFALLKDWQAHKSHVRRCAVLSLIGLTCLVGSVNLYLTSRHAQEKERSDTDEKARAAEQIKRLELAVDSERQSHHSDTQDFLAALDRVYSRLGALQTDQKTRQLRQDILNLQESLTTSDKVAADVLRSRSAKIGFGFFTPNVNAIPPGVTHGRVVDGHVEVEITAFNHSETNAVQGELVVRICQGCKFAEEPEHSIHIVGAMEKERVIPFNVIGTQARLEKIRLKIIPPDAADSFTIACLA